MAAKADPIDVMVGQRIRAYRLARKMTQSQLGKKIGVSFQQIQKYERGANRLGSSRLLRVADVLGLPVAALFGEGHAGLSDNLGEALTSLLSQPQAARLLRAFDAIKNPKQRLALMHLAESLSR
jgi:transcriptional regulator with XRE-family HTH domain